MVEHSGDELAMVAGESRGFLDTLITLMKYPGSQKVKGQASAVNQLHLAQRLTSGRCCLGARLS